MRPPTWLMPAVVVLTAAGSARADWPMARRDPQRTAFAPGSSDIDRPALRWRYYLGGSLSAGAYVAHDVDGDGLDEAIYVAGGKLLAKKPNDALLWETQPLALHSVAGIFDFNGDRALEVVVQGARGRTVLVNVADGRVLWTIPNDVLGEGGAALVADLNGDGLPDLYLPECRCCTFNSGQIGVAYSFPRGFAPSDVVEMWRLVGTVGEGACGASGDTIADLNGDGALEVVYAGHTALWGVTGSTGRLAYRSPSMGPVRNASALGDVADVDGDRRPELFLFEDLFLATDSSGKRWVAMFDYDVATDSLVRRWFREVANPATDRHRFHGRSLVDADGDGTWEVVTSFYDAASDTWTLYVLSAVEGAVLGSVTGHALAGVADVTGDGVPEFFGDGGDGRLTAFRFAGGRIATLWTVAGVMPFDVLNRGRSATRRQAWETATLDVDRDGIAELLAATVSDDPTARQRIVALNADLAVPTEAASYVAPPGVRLGSAAFSAGFTAAGRQLLMVRNDGYLVSFDNSLAMTNFSDDPHNAMTGLRIGGYYSGASGIGHTPISVRLGAGPGPERVIVRTSRGAMVNLDPSMASLAEPPVVVWERSVGWYPIAVDLVGDAVPEIVHWTTTRTVPPASAVEAVRADGTLVWSTTITDAARSELHDLPYGDANADGTPDVFVGARTTAAVEEANVLNGRNGRRLWGTDFARPISWGSFAKAVDDVNGDGRADLIGVFNSFLALSGGDGAILRENATFVAYLLPLVADVTGDAAVEYFLHGGYFGSRLMRRSDFAVLWTAENIRYTGAFGTLVRCGGAPVFVSGLSAAPEMRFYDAPTGAVLARIWLAGGRAFASEAGMLAAGVNAGFLTCVTGTGDLAGTGVDTVLVGSTDGHLYALNACDRALLWAMNLRFPVGEPLVTDTDGDGRNDVLVSVADGYLYNVYREVLPAPEWVWDTDPPGGYPAEDRDTIETVDELYATWAPVAGATSYEYGVMTPGGTFLTRPNFVNVGAVTEAAPSRLALRAGGTYHFAVRAIGSAGASSETISDGIRIVDESPPTATLRALPNPFSPDGDGTDDTITIVADMADRGGLAGWSMAILYPGGLATARTFPLRSVAGTATSDFVIWDGVDDSGGVIGDEGDYEAVATVRDLAGRSTIASTVVRIRFVSDADAGADVDEDYGADGDADANNDAEEADAVGDAEPDIADADAGADVDAGFDARDDAAPDAGGPDGEGAGCSCRAAGGRDGAGVAPALLAWLAAVAAHRWSRRRRAAKPPQSEPTACTC